jgi:malate dehydrogenase (oxaloacetate-decarboxylating)
MDIYEESLARHKKLKGKIKISLRDDPDTVKKLSLYYSPGVAAVSRLTAKHPERTRDYTWTNNLVAVISDGSAVLGLGDIGPYGALPVMEGKALLFKHFAGIDSVPIVLDVHEPDQIVESIKAIAPSFGGINLEDIAAPKCFEVEQRLRAELPIPVFHDDQHGTAIVTLAGLINALKVRDKENLAASRIVIVGSGAAGVAIAKLLYLYGAKSILMVDSVGIIGPNRKDLTQSKEDLLYLNRAGIDGTLAMAVKGSHIFIGVSKAGLLSPEMVKTMAPQPIIFAMANPEPEIMPNQAKKAGALVIATGRSDFPNQVNNAVAFPGVFRGALDNNVQKITEKHKIAAAEAIASLIDHPTADNIIPSVLDKRLVPSIAKVIV